MGTKTRPDRRLFLFAAVGTILGLLAAAGIAKSSLRHIFDGISCTLFKESPPVPPQPRHIMGVVAMILGMAGAFSGAVVGVAVEGLRSMQRTRKPAPDKTNG
jgi:hypothetical protein